MYPIYGITNKVFINDIPKWNIFFEVDTKKKSDAINLEKQFQDEFGSFFRKQSNKGFHYIFFTLFDKIEETLAFAYLKEIFEKAGMEIDYKHDSSYKHLKEDFKVLRFSSKHGLTPPTIKKLIYKKQQKHFTMDFVKFYKLDEYYIDENLYYFILNNKPLLIESVDRYVIKYEIGE